MSLIIGPVDHYSLLLPFIVKLLLNTFSFTLEERRRRDHRYVAHNSLYSALPRVPHPTAPVAHLCFPTSITPYHRCWCARYVSLVGPMVLHDLLLVTLFRTFRCSPSA